MTSSIRFSLSIVGQLVRADLKAFRQIAVSETIDLLVWVGVVTVITGYIMPLFNVPMDFILLNFAGVVASSVSFRSYPNIANLVSDFHGDKTIAQRLISPISPWLVFLSMATSCFLITMIICVWVFPMCTFIMWQLFDIEQMSFWRFALIFVTSSWFFAILPIFMASFVSSPVLIGKVWIRFLFPLWFFGGFQFTWWKLYEAWPIAAYLDLLNPYLYMMEGTRVAILGPVGNVPFWIDVAMLLMLSVICFVVGVRRLKRQLDFVGA